MLPPRQSTLPGVFAQHAEEVERAIDDTPYGARWMDHLQEDLLPFWTTDVALDNPVGNFPTYRHNDGSAVDPRDPGEFGGFKDDPRGIVWLERDYVRMKSRQIYAYGVAYHLTGEEKYLGYAKAGADWLLENAVDADGTLFTYHHSQTGWGPERDYRTSQDFAYGLLGIAFLYYLTRSPLYAQILVRTHEEIRRRYYDSELQHFRWVLANSPEDRANQRELVAQLDQVYAYMLLAGPILPCSKVPGTQVSNPREDWTSWLKTLSRRLMQQFYSPSTGMFWGAITSWKDQELGTNHTDFGHTVKTFWLISLIGQLTDDYEMFTAAQRRAARILSWAYLEETGSWANSINRRGELEKDKVWWTYCELDQVAGALAMNDAYYARYIAQTHKYWFDYMVDRRHHEVWHSVKADTNLPDLSFPKQHAWKNAMHSFEHVLVSYLVCQQLHSKEVELCYAFEGPIPNYTELNPYFYNAKVRRVEPVDSQPNRQRVTFTDVGAGSPLAVG